MGIGHHLALLLGGSLWGLGALLIRCLGSRGWAVLDIAPIRGTVSFVLLAGLVLATRPGMLAIRPQDRRYLVLAGILGPGLTGPLFMLCIMGAPLGIAVLLNYGAPVYAAILSWPLLGERPDRRKVLALTLLMLGLLLVTGLLEGAAGEAVRPRTGALLAGFCSGLTFALYLVTTRRVATSCDPAAMQVWKFGAGLPVLWGMRVLWGGPPSLPPLDLPAVGLLLLLALGPHIAGHLLVNYGLARVQAAPGSILLTTEPLMAMALGWAVLGERATIPQLAGMGLILAAIGAASSSRPRPGPVSTPCMLSPRGSCQVPRSDCR